MVYGKLTSFPVLPVFSDSLIRMSYTYTETCARPIARGRTNPGILSLLA